MSQLQSVFHAVELTKAEVEASGTWLADAKTDGKVALLASIDDVDELTATGRLRYQVEYLDNEGDHVNEKHDPDRWTTVRVTAITDVDTP